MRSADLAYEPGSPKRSDYTGRGICALWGGIGGHDEECPEVVFA